MTQPQDLAARVAQLEAELEAARNGTTNNSHPDPRAATLAAFTKLTGLPPIDRIIQRGREADTARFTIIFTDQGEVRVGTIKILWSRAELSKVLLVARGVVPEPCKPSEWTDAIGALFRHVVEVQETPDDSFQETTRDWLSTYARRASTDVDGAADAREPFTKEGDLYVTANGLAKYVRREHLEQVKLVEIRQALTDLGFQTTKVNYSTGRGGYKTRSSAGYYHGPLTIVSSPSNDDEAQAA